MESSGSRFIYIACPWGHFGGGMFKVADYLIQSQVTPAPPQHARLIALDTRGARTVLSPLVLLAAVGKLVAGRLSGRLAGVHVNMAERLSFFRKGTIIAASRLLGLPVVLHVHAAQFHHFYRKLPRPLQALARWIFSLADRCIVLGEVSRAFVTETLNVPPEKLAIVVNGVPGPSVPRRMRRRNEPRRILFLGNLSERKGVSDLLRALAIPGFKQAVVVSIAGGGDVAHYQDLAAELGIAGFVRFEGWADQDTAAGLMAAADVLVLPSYDEGLPLVILEALANSVAVVCTPVGEIDSVLSNGINACFVKPGDVSGIAAALHRTLNDQAFRHKLEQNGWAVYESQFSMARFFSNIADIHKSVFGISAASRLERPVVRAGREGRILDQRAAGCGS